jgi:hypothetical protein
MPAGIMAKGIGMVAKTPKVAAALSKSGVGRFVASALTPAAMPVEYASAAGAGALTGAVDPETWYGKLATGIAGGVGGASVAGLANSFGPGAVKNFIGRSELKEQIGNARRIAKTAESKYSKLLNAGGEVSDVNFGKLPENQLERMNYLKELDLQPVYKDGNVIIAADNIQNHILPRHILNNDKFSPAEFSKIVDDALYSKKSIVSRQNTKGAKPSDNLVSVNPETRNAAFLENKNGSPSIKTGYELKQSQFDSKLKDTALDRRESLSSAPSEDGLAGSLSALQHGHKSIINQPKQNVKPLTQQIIEALGTSKDNSTVLKRSVQSGAKEIREQATIISDAIARAKTVKGDGTLLDKFRYMGNEADNALTKQITTPEMSAAEKSYQEFMKNAGKKQIPEAKIAKFYEENPIAQGVLDTARKYKLKELRNVPENS